MKLTPVQLVVVVIVIVVIILLAMLGVRQVKGTSGKRQAVFLTNGQVYFGFVKNEGNQIVTVTDVYYLQAADASGSVQPADTKANAANAQVSLVKLGNELHGPENGMRINRDHILFFEDMKNDAKVNEAIKNYKP